MHARRETQHITQNELASILHVAQERVSAIERGRNDRFSIEAPRRYAEALGGELHSEVDVAGDRVQIV